MFLEAGFEILARFGGEQGRFWQILKHVSSYFFFISEPDKESDEELDEEVDECHFRAG